MGKPSESRSSRKSRRSEDQVRQALLEQKQEILDMYEHDIRAGQESGEEGSDDILDRANAAYNRELLFSLGDAERQTLRQIDEALRRLDDGRYGKCEHCGTEIAEARLEAVPWTRHCIGCQELEEKGLLESS